MEATGERVERFSKGDAVFYTPEVNERGSYAEYHAASARIVAHKPTGLSHEKAAALPLAEVAEAHRRLESGGVPGKLVLRV